ncbi:hypothetical protein ACFY3M_52930 [Streptomyces mirabilis]
MSRTDSGKALVQVCALCVPTRVLGIRGGIAPRSRGFETRDAA